MNKAEEDIVREIVDRAIEVHRVLGGPGLLESVYEEALCSELVERRLRIERQKVVPVVYKGRTLANPLRVDLLVESRIVVECKATSNWNEIFAVQALTYLRVLGLRLAIVINFGRPLVKDGIERVVNGY